MYHGNNGTADNKTITVATASEHVAPPPNSPLPQIEPLVTAGQVAASGNVTQSGSQGVEAAGGICVSCYHYQ